MEFACSKNKAIHACGHDAHGAMLLGVAKVLKQNENNLNEKVKIIFQPGEEYDGGAKVMIDEGVLENAKVDAVFAQHVVLLPGLKTGMIVIKDNQVMASSDRICIKVKGKGGHASTPENCINPIIMASREISALDSTCISIVNVKSEHPHKVAYNIIPNYVETNASVRCLENKSRDYLNK